MADPYADICSVAGDHFSDFLDEETGRAQERSYKQPAQECLIDDEKRIHPPYHAGTG
jgi:hypothetical protein